MFEAAASLREEFANLEREMADPSINTDASRSRRVGRRYSELTPIVAALDEHERLREDLAAARELGADDPEFASEAERLQGALDAVSDRLLDGIAAWGSPERIAARIDEYLAAGADQVVLRILGVDDLALWRTKLADTLLN